MPPDLSLSVAEYVTLGIADPARPWSRASRDAAREILWGLRERDPALLPRAGSPRSDAVFRRLVSESLRVSIEENLGVSLDALAEMSAEEVSGARRAHSPIGIYLPSPDDRLVFDRELVELGAASVDAAVDALESHVSRLRDLGEQPSEARRADDGPEEPALRDYGRLFQDALLSHLASLADLSAAEAFSAGARQTALEHLERATRRAMPLVTESNRALLLQLLEEIRAAARSAKAAPD